jgi:hypothetical protein
LKQAALSLFTGTSLAVAVILAALAGRRAGSMPIDDLPFRTDRDRSDAYALRIEDLIEEGTPAAVAEDIAPAEFDDGTGTECLTHTIVLYYCFDGQVTRVLKRINSACLEAIGGTAGCTPLVCPPGWAPPAPCPLMPCPAPKVPMLDTLVDPTCAGLPSSVLCLWMYPASTAPSWTPCMGILGCGCFPDIASDCAGLVIECRNPASPRNAEGECPDCGW